MLGRLTACKSLLEMLGVKQAFSAAYGTLPRHSRIGRGPTWPGPVQAKAAPPARPTFIPPPVLPDKTDTVWDNCALLVDKPETWTSHDVCAKMKVLLNVKKIGHAGTLDLLASGGLLAVLAAEAAHTQRPHLGYASALPQRRSSLRSAYCHRNCGCQSAFASMQVCS